MTVACPNAVVSHAAVIRNLLSWYSAHGRHDLPWRKTTDPYRILISELMLQQTQVNRVIPKYEEFLAAFPTLEALANADRAQVLRLWQGLGYNSRAARLHAMAKLITARDDAGVGPRRSTHAGALPHSREELLELPGIGPYTAGAIMIFAHDTPAVSVDVNVERVLKRVFWPPREVPTRAQVDALSLSLIERSRQPRRWHAALMDLGATVCTARSPRCDACPLRKQCRTRGVRPEELAAKPKQSAFLGSTRWWRGQILKRLLSQPAKAAHLLHRIKESPTPEDEDRYTAALDGLKREGLVREEKGMLHVV